MESEQAFRNLFGAMTSGIALHEGICDSSGTTCDYRFLSVNAAFERITGLTAEKVVGRTLTEVLPDTDPFWIETYGWVAVSGEPVQFEHFSQHFGRYFEVSAYCPAPGQFAIVLSDITERKMLDNDIRAKMSLGIRTSIEGVLCMTDLLLETNLSAEQKKYLELTKQSSEPLIGLLNDILDLSKIEA